MDDKTITAATGLTKEEQRIITLIRQLWESFVVLPPVSPIERSVFAEGMQRLQDIIMARPTYRSYAVVLQHQSSGNGAAGGNDGTT